MDEIYFTIKPRPPFRLDLTVWALRRLPHNTVDRWDGEKYSRVFAFNGRSVLVNLSQSGPADSPVIRCTARGKRLRAETELKSRLSSLLKKMFGIDKDLSEFYRISRRDRNLRSLVEPFIGLKPPRFPSVFEALVNAVACQQVSLNVGITLLNRLAEVYGAAFSFRRASFHAFPSPHDLSRPTHEDLRRLGFSHRKGRYIVDISVAADKKGEDLQRLESITESEVVDYLSRIKGVGRWSSEYVLLRGLGHLNVFPGDDIGAQKNIQQLLNLEEKPDYERLKAIIDRWEPYSGFVYFHLLLGKLRAKGYIS